MIRIEAKDKFVPEVVSLGSEMFKQQIIDLMADDGWRIEGEFDDFKHW